MKRFLLCFLFLLCFASNSKAQRLKISASGVVTANVNDTADFQVVLTANVSGVTLSAPSATPDTGYVVTMRFTQDGTGGRTVIFAGNLVTGCIINSTALSTTVCRWQYTASNNTWADAGGSIVTTFPAPGTTGTSLSYNSTTGTWYFTRQDSTFSNGLCFANAGTPNFSTGSPDFSCDSMNVDGQRNLQTYHCSANCTAVGGTYIVSSAIDLDQDGHIALAASTGGGFATDPGTGNSCIPATISPLSCKSTVDTEWNSSGQRTKLQGVTLARSGFAGVPLFGGGATIASTLSNFTLYTTLSACPGSVGSCIGTNGAYDLEFDATVSSAGTASTIVVTVSYTDDVQAQANTGKTCVSVGPSGVTTGTATQAMVNVGDTMHTSCKFWSAASSAIKVTITFAGSANPTISEKTFLYAMGN